MLFKFVPKYSQSEITKNNVKEVCELANKMSECNMLWPVPCLLGR